MNTQEFNLSEKREELLKAFLSKISVSFDDWKMFKEMLEYQDKEFIRLLKEDTGCHPINSREKQIIKLFKERINKLAGSKLIL